MATALHFCRLLLQLAAWRRHRATIFACLACGALLHLLTWQLSSTVAPHIQRQPAFPGVDLQNPTAKDFDVRYDSYEPRLLHRGGWAVAERCRRPLDMLVFVHCSAREWQRRAALRDTLFEEAALRQINWTGVFFSGRPSNDSDLDAWLDLEADLTGDLVVFPVKDGHFNITPKLLGGMRWVADHCPTVQRVIKIDDDVMVNPFKVQEYYRQAVVKKPQYLHCSIFLNGEVIRVQGNRFYASEEDCPQSNYITYCSGRSVIMTYAVMRELIRAAALISIHPTDDAFGFGDLALTVGIGHVDISQFMEWNESNTDCVFNGNCMLTHESTKYGANSLRRGQWGLMLWHYRLVTDDSVDLSPRLETAGYRKMFRKIRRQISMPWANRSTL